MTRYASTRVSLGAGCSQPGCVLVLVDVLGQRHGRCWERGVALWLRWLKRKETALSNRAKRGPWGESVPHTWEPRKAVQPRGEGPLLHLTTHRDGAPLLCTTMTKPAL